MEMIRVHIESYVMAFSFKFPEFFDRIAVEEYEMGSFLDVLSVQIFQRLEDELYPGI